jgi:hypothetical protein
LTIGLYERVQVLVELAIVEKRHSLARVPAIAALVVVGDGAEGIEVADDLILRRGIVDEPRARVDDRSVGQLAVTVHAGGKVLRRGVVAGCRRRSD